jgi:hypothetical protein
VRTLPTSPPRRALPAVAGAVLAVALLAGCGSDGGDLLGDSARSGLHTRVDGIRTSLGDPARAAAALREFRAEVRRLRDSGELHAEDARVLLAQAAQIGTLLPSPPPSPSATPTAPVVVVRVPERGADGPAEGTAGGGNTDEAKGKGKQGKQTGKDKKTGRKDG